MTPRCGGARARARLRARARAQPAGALRRHPRAAGLPGSAVPLPLRFCREVPRVRRTAAEHCDIDGDSDIRQRSQTRAAMPARPSACAQRRAGVEARAFARSSSARSRTRSCPAWFASGSKDLRGAVGRDHWRPPTVPCSPLNWVTLRTLRRRRAAREETARSLHGTSSRCDALSASVYAPRRASIGGLRPSRSQMVVGVATSRYTRADRAAQAPPLRTLGSGCPGAAA